MSRKKSNDIDVMTIRRTVRLTNEEDKAIKEFCKKTGMTKSDVLREGIRRILKDTGNKNKW